MLCRRSVAIAIVVTIKSRNLVQSGSCQHLERRRCDVHSLGRDELPRCEVMPVDALLFALPSLYLHIWMTIFGVDNIHVEWIIGSLCRMYLVDILASR